MMKSLALVAMFVTLFASSVRAEDAVKEAKLEGKHECYEMRTYTAAEGKLEALHARFRNHTNKLFLKHGMTLIGYWTPSPLDKPKDGEVDRSKNTLVYILAYPDRESRETMWKAFQSDPEWKAAREESEKNGKLVLKVESVFMSPTDFSPIK
jgi:hypothetical protein